MARSAAQSASRRLRRQTQPHFPLSRLPLELQLLILCKCDLRSFHRLLRLSLNLRTLFLRYPESSFQHVLQQLPRPVAGYLCASWALHNVEYSSSAPALELLRKNDISEFPTLDWPVTALNQDPLGVVSALVDMYEEVETAVGLYVQCVNAAVESVVNPWVQTTPITLSPNEHLRFASAFWILKICVQYTLKFSHVRPQDYQTFVTHLHPSQVEQVLSLDHFMQNIELESISVLYKATDSWEDFREQSLFDDYTQATRWLTFGPPPSLRPISLLRASQTNRQVGSQQAAQLLLCDGALPSYGSVYYNYIRAAYRIPRSKSRAFFRDLGMFFWDYERLVEWNLANPNDFLSTLGEFECRVSEMSAHAHRNVPPLLPRKEYLEYKKADLLLRWTRYPFQCSFEEWSQNIPCRHSRWEQTDPFFLCRGCEKASYRRNCCIIGSSLR